MDKPCACTTVRKANRALFRFYEEALEACEISITQFSILRALERNGPMALSALAEELVMERTSLYRTIKPLQELKAIKITNASIGRAKIASLTSYGRSLIVMAKPHWDRAQRKVIGLIGKSEWRALSKQLLLIPALLSERP